eukprot:TRINITY_DN1583_c0_g3_i2.p1 TRINITY_DN1583_c0_g3~~TRINITY_DN1583_c0_g3_i2.p1  ORF type:complete len:260 (+),score=21.01 TRINITY_DN1583_c0_g3_i2:445-1224(+)
MHIQSIGGHIEGAINLKTPAELESKFFDLHEIKKSRKTSAKEEAVMEKAMVEETDHEPEAPITNLISKEEELTEKPDEDFSIIIVFYCEFSQQRAPRMYRRMRLRDRELNEYPKLSYPRIYLLDGGYSGFCAKFSTLCGRYVSMFAKEHRESCEREEKEVSQAWRSCEGSKSEMKLVVGVESPRKGLIQKILFQKKASTKIKHKFVFKFSAHLSGCGIGISRRNQNTMKDDQDDKYFIKCELFQGKSLMNIMNLSSFCF